MELAVRRKGPEGNASMAASKRFGKYKDESQKATRDVVAEECETLRGIVNAWQTYTKSDEWRLKGDYSKVCDAIRGLEYSAQDVERFCVLLAEYSDDDFFESRAGFFLSGLINLGKDTSYELNIPQGMNINYLGLGNRKEIIVSGDLGDHIGLKSKGGTMTVYGNVGHYLGREAFGGKIIVEGNVGDKAGGEMIGAHIEIKGDVGRRAGSLMRGGLLRVHGNAGDELGAGMKGGRIEVEGDAGKSIGSYIYVTLSRGGYVSRWDVIYEGRTIDIIMRAGEIHINGSIGSIADDIHQGKIFHKGKLILDL
jgi:formylmethanofuran dehydrogenase subunit C